MITRHQKMLQAVFTKKPNQYFSPIRLSSDLISDHGVETNTTQLFYAFPKRSTGWTSFF